MILDQTTPASHHPMKILIYRGLDTTTIPGFDKLAGYLIAGDFRSAEVKKIGDNLYRARLDRGNRLLFALYRHGEERCILALEYIHQHAYENSRFLARGVTINEDLIPAIGPEATETAPELPYLNPALHRFHLLDKVLSFDDDQARRRSTASPRPWSSSARPVAARRP